MKSYWYSLVGWAIPIVLSLATTQAAFAQTSKYSTYRSDDELWQLGMEAYRNNDFSSAALYLYAYAQRHRPVLDNPDTKARTDFITVLKYVTKNLVAAAPSGKADDPRGCEFYPLTPYYYNNKPSPNLARVEADHAAPENPAPKPAPCAAVSFGVGVNDYPDHKVAQRSKNMANAYVNLYTVQLNAAGTAFEVVGVEIKSTGSGANPGATFWVQPGQMVDFEGFKTWGDAVRGATRKKGTTWTAPPPYKNFSVGANKLCQTNFLRVDQPLRNDWSYACATSLSTPYVK